MISINELPTMELHYFEAPNKVTIKGGNNTIIAETKETFDNDFILDAKSFDIFKKLKTDRVVKVGERITIKSKEGKYTCNRIESVLPELYLDGIVYTTQINVNEVKQAAKYVAKNQGVLCGVLFNDAGSVYATDSFRIWFKENGEKYNRWFSVPDDFINLINKDGSLEFTENKVIYNGDYKIVGSLYEGKVPAIEKAITISGKIVSFNVDDSFKLFPSDIIEFEFKDGVLKATFNDNEKVFESETNYIGETNANFKINYQYFVSAAFGNTNIVIGEGKIKVDDNVIICCVR